MTSKIETMIQSGTSSMPRRLVAALVARLPWWRNRGPRRRSGQTEKEKKMTKTESGLQYRESKKAPARSPRRADLRHALHRLALGKRSQGQEI